MNRRRKFWLAIAGAIFVGAKMAQAQPVSEPVYQGRSLDAWLHDLRASSTRDDAIAALCSMKPSPAPFLMERMRTQDSSSIDFASSLPPSARGWASAAEEQSAAVQGLMALGPAAKSVIPDLTRMISDPDPRLDEWAIMVLTQIGPPASAPALIEALQNMPPSSFASSRHEQMIMEMTRERLANAVSALGVSARPALPIFLNDLKNREASVRNGAVLALARIAPREAVVISALLERLKDPDPTTRRNAAHGLAGLTHAEWPAFRGETMRPTFDPLANATHLPAADPAVVAALQHMAEHDSEFNCREAATLSLITLVPKQSADTFTKNLQSHDVKLRRNSAWDLSYFKKGARGAVPSLIKCMSDKDAKVRQNSAVALREIGEQPNQVVPLLMRGLSDPDPETRMVDAVALGAFGNASKTAVPQLLEILKQARDDLDSSSILSALYNIDPETVERLDRQTNNEATPNEKQ